MSNWFALDVDWFNDPKFIRLSLTLDFTERAIAEMLYFRILPILHENDGYFDYANDIDILLSLCKIERGDVEICKKALENLIAYKLFYIDNGMITCDRMRAEVAKMKKTSEINSKNGKLGAVKRWGIKEKPKAKSKKEYRELTEIEKDWIKKTMELFNNRIQPNYQKSPEKRTVWRNALKSLLNGERTKGNNEPYTMKEIETAIKYGLNSWWSETANFTGLNVLIQKDRAGILKIDRFLAESQSNNNKQNQRQQQSFGG